ncbi:MAG: glutathione S-transferase family protein [Granulosicoccaceae bacterium]
MSDFASEIILHNYPQSPVAEKVRVAFGIKGLAWRDVEIPRLPPKPLLTPLTGGYRRTPVMQIGADIYCDSQCIIRELERRFPEPTFMPSADAGLMSCLGRWADDILFDLVVKIVLGSAGKDLPPDFAEDRGRLYFGADWANGLEQASAQLPHQVAQLRAPLSWLNGQLKDGRHYLLGPTPAAIDAQIYYAIWFIRGRWSKGASLLAEFPDLVRWEDNVRSLGHGTSVDMRAEEALGRAKSSQTIVAEKVEAHDPQGLRAGDFIQVQPDVDGGEAAVSGKLRYADAQTIVVEHTAPEVGTVCVHFPRAGYLVVVC